MSETEPPIVSWDRRLGLVGQDRAPITYARRSKARQILGRQLLQQGRVLVVEPGRMVTEWTCAPLPACKQTHRLVHEQRLVAGTLREAQRYACDCQGFNGTRTTTPELCSHAIALRAHIEGEEP